MTRQPCPSRPPFLAVGANFLGDDRSAESVLVKLGEALVPIRSGRSNSCGVGVPPAIGCRVGCSAQGWERCTLRAARAGDTVMIGDGLSWRAV
jgi:hypothetical protein